MAEERKIYATFFGNEKYPVTWESEEEKDLMWWYDDLHCPNPISPMYFSCGGWWGPTCKYSEIRTWVTAPMSLPSCIIGLPDTFDVH